MQNLPKRQNVLVNQQSQRNEHASLSGWSITFRQIMRLNTKQEKSAEQIKKGSKAADWDYKNTWPYWRGPMSREL